MDFKRRLVLLLFVMLGVVSTPVSAQTTTYYGAPYYPPVSQYPSPFRTVDEAVRSWFAYFNVHYGLYPPRCNLFWTRYSSPGSSTVALVWLRSPTNICGGGPNGIAATAYTFSPQKNLGRPDGISAGDPINLATGNEFHEDVDFKQGWLSFDRYYNSNSNTASTTIGSQWRHSYDRSLQLSNSNTTPESGPLPPNVAVLSRPDGFQEKFTKSGTQWATDPDVADRLTESDNAQGVVTGYTAFIAATHQFESYDPSGLLLAVTDETGRGISLTYSTSLTAPDIAPSPGLLLNVTDPNGRQLTFNYDSGSHIHQITQPDGGVLTYVYDPSTGNLLSVRYPDGKSLQYVYETIPLLGSTSLSALKVITDEAGSNYVSFSYDSNGKATQSSFAGGANQTTVTYNSNGTTSTRYALGLISQISFSTVQGRFRVATVNQPCSPACAESFKTQTYDVNGYPALTTDFNNNVTATTYDANGLLDQQVGASGTSSQRTTNTTWDTVRRNPLARTVLDASGNTVAKTAWVYSSLGQPIARCEIDPTNGAASGYACASSGTAPAGVRRWTYTYCDIVGSGCPLIGLMLTATGPRTDLTQAATYSYYTSSSASGCGTPGAACYQAGDLYQVTDPLGHVTTIASYDGAGRVTRVTDANGINTDMTYTPRGWLASRSVGGVTTTLSYTPYGAIASLTDPDGITTSYTYDAAHRLTDITDAQGNVIHYTLDAAGNKTAEQIRTSSGTVVHSLSRTYNTLGQLTAMVDGLNHTVFNAGASGSYDANGNLVQSADALGIQQHRGFDALNRLVSTIANYNGTDIATKNTQSVLAYDANDRLEGVSDPDGLSTSYDYDGLGNRTALHSPDTGTSNDTYDAAGNRLTHTDAKGVVSTSAYDTNNRLTGTGYADTTLNVSYAYDEANAVTGCSASSPIGRLTRVVEAGVSTVFCYDGRGNVIQKRQVTSSQTDTTLYAYTAGNRLSSVSAPDQTVIGYTYDSVGRINGVQVTPSGMTAALPTVVSSISYLPFGPISSYTLGNGQTVTRTYDANYRLTDLTSPALSLHVARDALGNIIALGNAPGANPATETYSYDPLYRLTDISDTGVALESYTHNPTGDRLSKTAPGLATGIYLYASGTHQLASIGGIARANDANGNTTGSVTGGNTYGFGYNGRNRLTVVQLNGQAIGAYTYNAMGQRIGKVATFPQATTRRYAYDEAGQLIGEYGTTNRDYVWLDGMPVAVIDNTINGSVTTSVVNYVTADQLGAPRAVTDGTGTVIWQWAYQGNPFGEQQPTSSSGYVLNLRLPGQYFDVETGLHYNGARYYDPTTGRYLQSDPIGLLGGMSTYGYARNAPMSYVDPLGLFVRGTYSISTGLLSFYDTSNPMYVYSTYASTGGTFTQDGSFVPNGDAIPVGTYDILGARTPGWYRLDPEDSMPFNDIDDSNGRGAFRLHSGTHSLGCVTVNKNAYDNTLYQNIRDLIDHTVTTTISDQSERSLIPGPYPIRYGGPVGTPVTYYGKLVITP